MYVPKYFKAYEFVSEKIYKIYGDNSLLFVSDEMKETLDLIREFFGVPIYINNWRFDGTFHNRGYRDPFSSVGSKLSQHKFGRAVDFHSQIIPSSTIREQIFENKNLFPYIYRMEKDTSWVHIDMHPDYKDKRIYLFNP